MWAWKEVQEAVASRDPKVVLLLERLADSAPSEAALAYLGAGPLEDLLHLHDATLIDRVEAAARRSSQFRSAVASVWYSGGDEHVAQFVAEARTP